MSEFILLGPERFGDGGADTQPVSSAMLNTLWANTQLLAEEPRTICWSPIIALADTLTSPQGTRPFAMHSAWLSVFRAPVYVPRGATSLLVYGAHYVLTPSAVTDSESGLTLTFDATAKTIERSAGTFWTSWPERTKIVIVGSNDNDGTYTLVGITSTTLTVEEDLVNETATSGCDLHFQAMFGELDMRVTIDGRVERATLAQTRWGFGLTAGLGRDVFEVAFPAHPGGVAWLDIAIRSARTEPVPIEAGGVAGRRRSATTNGFEHLIREQNLTDMFFIDGTATNPDYESFEVAALGMETAGGTAMSWFDVVGLRQHVSKGDGVFTSEALVANPAVPPGVGGASWDQRVDAMELAYLSPRAMAMRFVCDRESVGRIDRDELRPNILLTGSAPGRQISAARALLTRPRTIGWGPEGTLRTADFYFTSLRYRRCWPVLRAHQVMLDRDPEGELWSQVVYLTTPNPTLTINQWVTCITPRTWGNAQDDGGRGKDGKPHSSAAPGCAVWRFHVVVDTLDDVGGGGADWATDTTQWGEVEATEAISMYASNEWSTDTLIGRTINFIEENNTFAHKEGGLCLALGDGTVLQQLSLTVHLAGLTDDTINQPVRVRVFAAHDWEDERNDYLNLQYPGSPGGTISRYWGVHLIGGNYTITENPVASEVLTGLRPENLLPRARVRASDWAAINERLYYHWLRAGSVMPGRVYDPPFETSSPTHTTANDGTGLGLDTWAGVLVPQRLANGKYVLQVQAYVQDLEVRLHLVRFDSRLVVGAYTQTIELSSSTGAAELVTELVDLALADAHEEGDPDNPVAVFYASIDARALGGTGYMWLSPSEREWVRPVLEFPREALTDLGRTAIYSGSGTIEIAYAHSGSGAPDLVCATAGGTGRITNVTPKMVSAATGAVAWTAPVSDLGAGRCVFSQGSSDLAVFAGADDNSTFANFSSAWKDSDTPPALVSNVPTTTATPSGTTHTVDVPALSAGDLLVVICTASANPTMTLPSGNWAQRYSEAFASTRRALCFVLLGATGLEGSTVEFTSSATVDASWAVYHFAAGQWDAADTPTAASVVEIGSAANGTNTAPNPGSISPFENNGEYALIGVVHVSDVETFSADPAGFTDGTTIQSATTTTRGAVKFGPGENPPAFTKSGSAAYRTRAVAVRTGVGTGLRKDDDFSGLAKYDSDGNMLWWTKHRTRATGQRQVTCAPDGSTVFIWAGSGLEIDGQGSPIASFNAWIELDGETGAVVGSWNHDPIRLGRGNPHVALFGAAKDRVLVVDRGSLSDLLVCLDARDIAGGALWQLDKQTDFASGPWTSTLLIGRRTTGVLVATTVNNLLWLRLIADDGTIEKEIDVSQDTSGLGSNPRIEGVCEDKYGHIYVLVQGASGTDVVRYDAQGEFVWSAAGTFGHAQAATTTTNFNAGIPLLGNGLALNIAVGSKGHIFITENNYTSQTIPDGHVLRLKME